jgi:hypothetical protein
VATRGFFLRSASSKHRCTHGVVLK